MVEILIRGPRQKWASEIDFSTLREESTGLVMSEYRRRRR